MSDDYPAAHSMDTQWYAVDQDGNVGFFDSSEEGGVPLLAPSDWTTEDDPEFAALHAIRFARLLESGVDFDVPEQYRFERPQRIVVVLDPPDGVDPRDLSAYIPELDGEFMAKVRVEPPVVLMSRVELGGQYIEDVRALDVVRGAWRIDTIEELLDHHRGPDGIYHFDYAEPMESPRPYRYERTTAPTQAIQLSELPSAVRDKLLALRLQLDFEQARVVRINRYVKSSEIKTWYSR
ncbi:MAG: hypothetical protein AAF799_15260 [Myxococcota bacterium]